MDEAEILGYEFTKPNCSESWLANPNNSRVLTTQYSPDLDANSTRGYTITVSTSLYCGQEPCSSTGSFLVFPNETFRVQILPPPSEKLLNSFTLVETNCSSKVVSICSFRVGKRIGGVV